MAAINRKLRERKEHLEKLNHKQAELIKTQQKNYELLESRLNVAKEDIQQLKQELNKALKISEHNFGYIKELKARGLLARIFRKFE